MRLAELSVNKLLLVKNVNIYISNIYISNIISLIIKAK